MKEGFPSISIHIPALKTGNEKAWTEVCGRFQIGLSSKAIHLVRSSGTHRKRLNAEDLVQETFLKVWRNREGFHGETTAQLAKWMLTILKNTFLDTCRKKNIEQSKEWWQEVCGNAPTPSAIVSSSEQEAELLAALEELTADQQKVIAMRFFEGLTFPQIAEKTGANVNTVGGHFRRGLTRITKIMQNAPNCKVIRSDNVER